jgi:hypothetical protein
MRERDLRRADPMADVMSWVTLIVALIMLMGAGYMATVVRAQYKAILEDFEAQLPLATELLLSVPGYAYAAGIVALAVLLVLKEVLLPRAGPRIVLNFAAALFAIDFTVMFAVGLWLPLCRVIEQLR